MFYSVNRENFSHINKHLVNNWPIRRVTHITGQTSLNTNGTLESRSDDQGMTLEVKEVGHWLGLSLFRH